MKTIQIGTQKWSAKNLNVSKFRNGDPIFEAKTDKDWKQAGKKGKPAWCYYNNDQKNDKKYGKLYNWFAVADTRGLAPEGWHIPSDAEWEILIDYLGGEDVAGVTLKSVDRWSSPNTKVTSSRGFTALPGGYRSYSGTFNGIGSNGDWWGATEGGAGNAWSRSVYYGNGGVYRDGNSKELGFSVRCVKD